MINKEFYIKNVAESLALLSKQVELLNAVNLYDINIYILYIFIRTSRGVFIKE